MPDGIGKTLGQWYSNLVGVVRRGAARSILERQTDIFRHKPETPREKAARRVLREQSKIFRYRR